MKIKAFTLIELLVVIVIIGILSVLALPQFNKYRNKAGDAWREALITNTSKIILADEFISLDGVNFADLDSDRVFAGTNDPVTVADIKARLDNQDYALAVENQNGCFLYGYEAKGSGNTNMIMIVNKEVDTGAGNAGFIFNGTDTAKLNARNITAINCTPGSEGVTGGNWADYQWLNFIP